MEPTFPLGDGRGETIRSDYVPPEVAAELRPQLSKANALAVDVCAAAGLRISDTLGLLREDVRLALDNNCWLRVVEGKTGVVRNVRLPADLLERCLLHAGTVYVFPHRDDEQRHRTRQAVWAQLTRKAKDRPERITPHSFRKQYAVKLFRSTGDIGKVQRRMGHRHVTTTLLYATSDIQTAGRLRAQKNHRKAG